MSPDETDRRPGERDALPVLRVRVSNRTGERTHSFARHEITLGSGAHCDVRLDDTAEPTHCLLAVTRHGYVIEDLRSAGGTFVDDRPVSQAFVEPGDPIRIGASVVVVVAD